MSRAGFVISVNLPAGAGIDARAIDPVKTALERDQGRAPELAQQTDLLVDSLRSRAELLAQTLVLDIVPADSDSQPQAFAREQIHIGGLLRHQRRLSLGQDQHAGDEVELLGHGGRESEQDKRVVEAVFFRVGAGVFGLASFVRSFEHMVVGHDVRIAEFLRRPHELADGIRITRHFGCGV